LPVRTHRVSPRGPVSSTHQSLLEYRLNRPRHVSLGQLPGAIPLIVVHHGKPVYSVVPQYGAKIEQFWTAGQKTWGRLSSRSEVLIASKSGHYIYLDQPALTVQLVKKLIAQA